MYIYIYISIGEHSTIGPLAEEVAEWEQDTALYTWTTYSSRLVLIGRLHLCIFQWVNTWSWWRKVAPTESSRAYVCPYVFVLDRSCLLRKATTAEKNFSSLYRQLHFFLNLYSKSNDEIAIDKAWQVCFVRLTILMCRVQATHKLFLLKPTQNAPAC